MGSDLSSSMRPVNSLLIIAEPGPPDKGRSARSSIFHFPFPRMSGVSPSYGRDFHDHDIKLGKEYVL